MMFRLKKITMVLWAVFLVVIFFPHPCFSENYNYTFELLDNPEGSNRFQLTVSVTSSLNDYYQSKDHEMYSFNDLAKFVTPTSLLPIADSLWSIYEDDEDFANGVLMIVHQIPYAESGPQRYPVETIVDNEGDCDLLSFIAASVMKAGGLDVVLLYYEAKSHMNVGVNLSEEPEDSRFAAFYIDHEGKRYYVAECTGGNWENGWRVGECSDSLKNASVMVVTLEECEQSSPERVTSGYGVLLDSSISLMISPATEFFENNVLINGSVFPNLANQKVTIYLKSNSSSWNVLTIVETDADGYYSYLWTPQSAGTYYLRTSWSGDANYLGADSEVCSFTAVPVAHTVTLRVEDVGGNDLENAEVTVEDVNGSALTLYTDGDGKIFLDKVSYGLHNVTVFWHGVEVGRELLNVTSNGNYTVSCSVYDLTVEVKNLLDMGVRRAKVTVQRQAGRIFAQATTGVTGNVTFRQLPQDLYRVEVSCMGERKSKMITLMHSTTEAFLGFWDLTTYVMIIGIGTVIVIVTIVLLPMKR